MFTLPAYGGILSFSSALSLRRLGENGRDECKKAYAEVCNFFQRKCRYEPDYSTGRVQYIESDHTCPDNGWLRGTGAFVDEISRAPDDVLSFVDAASEVSLLYHGGGASHAINPLLCLYIGHSHEIYLWSPSRD